MKKLISIIWSIFLLISCSNEVEETDFKSALNKRVIGVGAFTMEENYCTMEDSGFSGWFTFPSDSTFLFYDRFLTQHKLNKGTFEVENDKISFHFDKEIAITRISHYADVPTQIEEVVQTIQDEYNQVYGLKLCGNRIMLEDENGNDYGIQIPKSFQEVTSFLKEKKLEIKTSSN